jgi:hypothetical protein
MQAMIFERVTNVSRLRVRHQVQVTLPVPDLDVLHPCHSPAAAAAPSPAP